MVRDLIRASADEARTGQDGGAESKAVVEPTAEVSVMESSGGIYANDPKRSGPYQRNCERHVKGALVTRHQIRDNCVIL
jgi:hypothetical protein